jgi:hypothetical protein
MKLYRGLIQVAKRHWSVKFRQQRGSKDVALRLGLPGVHFVCFIGDILEPQKMSLFLEVVLLQHVNRQQLQSFTRKIQNQTTRSKHFKKIFFYYFIIHMCIQGLGHFSLLPPPPPLPPTPPPPSPPTPSIPGRNYFALISNFVEERI